MRNRYLDSGYAESPNIAIVHTQTLADCTKDIEDARSAQRVPVVATTKTEVGERLDAVREDDALHFEAVNPLVTRVHNLLPALRAGHRVKLAIDPSYQHCYGQVAPRVASREVFEPVFPGLERALVHQVREASVDVLHDPEHAFRDGRNVAA